MKVRSKFFYTCTKTLFLTFPLCHDKYAALMFYKKLNTYAVVLMFLASLTFQGQVFSPSLLSSSLRTSLNTPTMGSSGNGQGLPPSRMMSSLLWDDLAWTAVVLKLCGICVQGGLKTVNISRGQMLLYSIKSRYIAFAIIKFNPNCLTKIRQQSR